jgi:hypothetical protein
MMLSRNESPRTFPALAIGFAEIFGIHVPYQEEVWIGDELRCQREAVLGRRNAGGPETERPTL